MSVSIFFKHKLISYFVISFFSTNYHTLYAFYLKKGIKIFRSAAKDQSGWFTSSESVVPDVVTPRKRVNPTKRMLPKKKISTSKSVATTSHQIIVSYEEYDDEITTSTTAVAIRKEVK